MTDPFDEPGPLDAIKWENYEHRLVLITPLEIKQEPHFDRTRAGMRDVTYADVVILDGPGSPEEFAATPIYQGFLQAQVRGNVGSGRSNLGRIGKDPSRQQPKQSAPWVLGAPTEADKQAARQYLAQRASRAAAKPVGGSADTTFTEAPPF